MSQTTELKCYALAPDTSELIFIQQHESIEYLIKRIELIENDPAKKELFVAKLNNALVTLEKLFQAYSVVSLREELVQQAQEMLNLLDKYFEDHQRIHLRTLKKVNYILYEGWLRAAKNIETEGVFS